MIRIPLTKKLLMISFGGEQSLQVNYFASIFNAPPQAILNMVKSHPESFNTSPQNESRIGLTYKGYQEAERYRRDHRNKVAVILIETMHNNLIKDRQLSEEKALTQELLTQIQAHNAKKKDANKAQQAEIEALNNRIRDLEQIEFQAGLRHEHMQALDQRVADLTAMYLTAMMQNEAESELHAEQMQLFREQVQAEKMTAEMELRDLETALNTIRTIARETTTDEKTPESHRALFRLIMNVARRAINDLESNRIPF